MPQQSARHYYLQLQGNAIQKACAHGAAASYALKVFAIFDIAIIGDVMTKISQNT